MVNKPKAIGTRTETAVVRYLREHGWPAAERRALRGTCDAGDITGTPGICWSVKGGVAAETASDAQINTWRHQLDQQQQYAHADVAVLVVKRRGHSTASAGAWWAVLSAATVCTLVDPTADVDDEAPMPAVRLRLADAAGLLRWAGYGQPLPDDTYVPAEVTG